MGTVELPEVYTVSDEDVEFVSIDYTDHLEPDEIITGTPTVVSVNSTALTIGTVAATTAAVTIGGRSVVAGQAIRFVVEGFVAGTTHEIKATVSTDYTPARTIVRQIRIISA